MCRRPFSRKCEIFSWIHIQEICSYCLLFFCFSTKHSANNVWHIRWQGPQKAGGLSLFYSRPHGPPPSRCVQKSFARNPGVHWWLGLHRYLAFALESPFRDIQEDLVFVIVSVFSISWNLIENSFPFSAFPKTSSKSCFCISCKFLFFPPVFFSCFLVFFSTVFQCFPCFSCFSLKNDISCLVSFPVYAHFSFWIPSRFPFLVSNSVSFPISRLKLHSLKKKLVSPTPTGNHWPHQFFAIATRAAYRRTGVVKFLAICEQMSPVHK